MLPDRLHPRVPPDPDPTATQPSVRAIHRAPKDNPPTTDHRLRFNLAAVLDLADHATVPALLTPTPSATNPAGPALLVADNAARGAYLASNGRPPLHTGGPPGTHTTRGGPRRRPPPSPGWLLAAVASGEVRVVVPLHQPTHRVAGRPAVHRRGARPRQPSP